MEITGWGMFTSDSSFLCKWIVQIQRKHKEIQRPETKFKKEEELKQQGRVR